MQITGYSLSRGAKAGALGGIAGAAVLGLFAYLASTAMNQEVPYVTIAKRLGFGEASVASGWILHFTVGIVAGAVFLGVTSRVKSLTLTTVRKGLWIGALAGIAVWLVVDVPVTGSFIPAYLTDPTFAVGSLFLHIVYGIVTAVVSLSILNRGAKVAQEEWQEK